MAMMCCVIAVCILKNGLVAGSESIESGVEDEMGKGVTESVAGRRFADWESSIKFDYSLKSNQLSAETCHHAATYIYYVVN